LYITFRYATDDNKLSRMCFAYGMIRATNTYNNSMTISFTG